MIFSFIRFFFNLQFRAGCLRWRIGHAFLGSGDPSEVSEKQIIAILLCRLNNSKKKKNYNRTVEFDDAVMMEMGKS